jgi:hypothetical protein
MLRPLEFLIAEFCCYVNQQYQKIAALWKSGF